MARIRTIKPGFFRDHELFLLEQRAQMPLRVAFAGLWTACDREGRFRWDPMALKLDALPYDDLNFERVLNWLATGGFISKYTVDGRAYGVVPSFTSHQAIPHREAQSTLPPPPEHCNYSAKALQLPGTIDMPALQCPGMPEQDALQLSGGREKEGKGKGTDILSVVEAPPSPPAEPSPQQSEAIPTGKDPDPEPDPLLEEAKAMVLQFREDYHDNVDPKYVFPKAMTSEIDTAKKWIRARSNPLPKDPNQPSDRWDPDRFHQLKVHVMTHREPKKPGSTWTGWASQIKSLGSLWEKRHDLEAKLVRGV